MADNRNLYDDDFQDFDAEDIDDLEQFDEEIDDGYGRDSAPVECNECDCEACRAFYEENGYVPEVDCEAAASGAVLCKCNYCELLNGAADEPQPEAAKSSGSTGRPAAADGSFISMLTGSFRNYFSTLSDPDPKNIIEPKRMYTILGITALGSVLFFFILAWFLCYCPVRNTGFEVEDFIVQFNSIVSESDVFDLIDADASHIETSDSDIEVLYPVFDDILIPEDADLRDGVLLCDGDILLKAKLSGSKIRSLTVSLVEDSDIYDAYTGSFLSTRQVDADYSNFVYYAVMGKTRLALNNLAAIANGDTADEHTLNNAVNYGVIMNHFDYYAYTVYGTHDPTLTYFEYIDTATISFDPATFALTVETQNPCIIPTDNGIYRFFDGIFGEKKTEKPAEVVSSTVPDDGEDWILDN